MAAGVLALLAAGTAVLVFSVPKVAYAARWAGTPGLFSVRTCYQVGTGKGQYTECLGVFDPDQGNAMDPVAQIAQPLAAGDRLPVQRMADGSYTPVGASPLFGWLTLAFFGVAILTTGLMAAVAATGLIHWGKYWWTPAVCCAAALLCALTAAVAHIVAAVG